MERRRIYRVVEERELLDLQDSGVVRIDPDGKNYATGKLFWRSLADARRWLPMAARAFPTAEPRRIVAYSIPIDAFRDLEAKFTDGRPSLFATLPALTRMSEDVEFWVEELHA